MAKNLKDFGNFKSKANFTPVTNVLNIPLVIDGYIDHKGNYGRWVEIKAHNKEGELLDLMTSGQYVMEALDAVKAANAFPVEVLFSKRGKAIICE